MSRRLDLLPKAHLHLHFVGAMRRSTLIELAAAHGIRLPEAFGTPGYFRLSCALGDADLEEGVTRMAKLLAEAR